MQRSIIIEGVDCAGKSTLAKELKSALGWDMRFLGHRSEDQFLRYAREYTTHPETVFERGHISEMVYGELFGRTQAFTKRQYRILDDLLRERFIIIACIPDINEVRRRYRERKHILEMTKFAELARCNNLFGTYFARFKDRNQCIIYRSRDFTELHRLVKRVVRLEAGADTP